MSYQVIARKWRPQSFEQLVGQDHVSKTLKNALLNGRVPQALLLTGPRGTGKTSTARIFAKSLRCPNAENFTPCHKCSSCEEIALGRSLDVIEIDGASNNGVDAIRDLRDGVSFMPAHGYYKVYIIDEVHMLSTSAFNALLKTLEEPPAHVVFIMATTEAHKIPATILSRCQRYDFRAIPIRLVAEALGKICASEKIEASPDALWMIARQGNGSMRDSQSLLDMAITFANGSLTQETVISILGLADRTILLESLSALFQRDTQQTLKVLQKIHQSGFDAQLYFEDLIELLRNTLMLKLTNGQNTELIEMPESERRFLLDLGANTTDEDLHLLFDMTLKAAQDLKKTSEPRFALEMALLRMSQAPRVQALKNWLTGEANSTTIAPTINQSRPRTPAPIPSPPPLQQKTTSVIQQTPHERWLNFVLDLQQNNSLLAAKLEKVNFVSDQNAQITLSIPPKLSFLKDQLEDKKTLETLNQEIHKFFGANYKLIIQSTAQATGGKSASEMVQAKSLSQQKEIEKQVAEHPQVKTIASIIQGQVTSIRPTNNSERSKQ